MDRKWQQTPLSAVFSVADEYMALKQRAQAAFIREVSAVQCPCAVGRFFLSLQSLLCLRVQALKHKAQAAIIREVSAVQPTDASQCSLSLFCS